VLTLLEEVVLLAVNETTGELQSARECATEYALAGAVLFDMSLAGRIDTDTEEITIVDCAGCGNPIVDRWLAEMASRPHLKTVEHWIEELVHRRDDLEGEALQSLEARGVLRHERSRRLWIVNVDRFPLLMTDEQQFVKRRLERAIFNDDIPAVRDIMLVSIAEACGLLRYIAGDTALDLRKHRISVLCNLETISRKVTAAIASLESFRSRAAIRIV
jgi:hypothetical protein